MVLHAERRGRPLHARPRGRAHLRPGWRRARLRVPRRLEGLTLTLTLTLTLSLTLTLTLTLALTKVIALSVYAKQQLRKRIDAPSTGLGDGGAEGEEVGVESGRERRMAPGNLL